MTQPKSLMLILYFYIQFLSSKSFNFTYHGFNDSNLIQEQATVIKPSGALRLTNTTQNVIGHAFFPTPILMFNNTNSNVSSFSTYFIFQIRPSSSKNNGGFGLAFTLSPSPRFLFAEGGHYLGIFNSSNDGSPLNHIFMVEFDTVNGYKEESNTNGNHVGININGMNSMASQPASYYKNGTQATEEVHLESGDPIQAWIDYDGVKNIVNVTVSPLSVPKPIRPLMSEVIDLSHVVMENMYAGFSAATGDKSSSHYILGWSFRINGEADKLDLNRIPYVPPEKTSSTNHKVKKALLASFAVLLFILLLALASIVFCRRVEVMESWELDCPHRFEYRELHKATKGFKESEKIGVGGFGAVYKGILPSNGAEIAVKKIMSNNPLQGMREFAAEIESLGRLRHKNLVNLQGWCKHKNDLLLVYEYVPNGSLDSLLYSSKNGIFLTWQQRFNIIKGIASGLLYLHEEWEQIVIHRDMKSSNVLIDTRLYDHGKTSHTTNVVGTIGYIAPELTRTGRASTSTDVFGYGILLLEVVCGRGPIVYEADRNVILVDWVVECMQKGNIFDAVDGKLNFEYEVEEVELVMGLGLLCSHPRVEVRPTMREVVKYLNGDEILPVFDKLSCAGSRRVDDITSRLLALGLISDTSVSTLFYTSSAGNLSSSSLDTGR
ncbi:hypothetical protein ACJIZ3_022182 [Penstemon smallii]|uniref:non-specific serine/threonine protein kinase n=1 Tax=Penstemon smallii TaxID=265156 RepID=A0ABD3SPK8_9LAMI